MSQNQQTGMDVLDDYELNISKNLTLLKMDYLHDQKRRLQMQISQLYLNNELMRQTNNALSEGKSVQVEALLKRNLELQKLMEKLFKQIREQRAHIFLTAQVKLEDEKEQKQIYEKYQSKILELRKSIQLKQGSIQILQQSLNKDSAWTQTTTIKLQLFQQIQQLKKSLQQCITKYNSQSAINQTLISQNTKLKTKLQKIQSITLSKCSYIQFKSLINQNTTKSLPKSRTNLKLQLRELKGRFLQNPQTNYTNRQSVTISNYQRDSNYSFSTYVTLYKIIKCKNQEIKKLNQNIVRLNQKIEAYQAQKKLLVQSNQTYQRSRRSITSQSNMYESICKMFYNYFMRRNTHQSTQNKTLHEDFNIPGIQNKLKQSLKNIQNKAKVHQFCKQDWLNMQQALANKEQLTNGYLALMHNRKRSYSSVIDYIVVAKPKTENQSVIDKIEMEENQFSIQLEYKSPHNQQLNIVIGSGNLQFQRKKKSKQCKSQNLFLNVFDD